MRKTLALCTSAVCVKVREGPPGFSALRCWLRGICEWTGVYTVVQLPKKTRFVYKTVAYIEIYQFSVTSVKDKKSVRWFVLV